VDAGRGWLIFALPPAELAAHPADSNQALNPANESLTAATVYLMCDHLAAEVEWLAGKGVAGTPIQEAGWGVTTTLRLPSAAKLGPY
jgi:hypothetical protein